MHGHTVFECCRHGPVNGLLLGFDSEIGPGIVIDSFRSRNWHPIFFPLPELVPLKAGETVEFEVTLSGSDPQHENLTAWSVCIGGDRARTFACRVPNLAHHH